METIKRQAGTVCVCLAERLDRVCWLSTQPIGWTVHPSLWRTALWKLQLPLVAIYKCLPLPLPFLQSSQFRFHENDKCSNVWQVYLTKSSLAALQSRDSETVPTSSGNFSHTAVEHRTHQQVYTAASQTPMITDVHRAEDDKKHVKTTAA